MFLFSARIAISVKIEEIMPLTILRVRVLDSESRTLAWQGPLIFYFFLTGVLNWGWAPKGP
jgi:uncharacterized membrane protein